MRMGGDPELAERLSLSKTRNRARKLSHDRGFALLVVLWSLGFLALIGMHVLLVGRHAAQATLAEQAEVAAELAADGALSERLYDLATRGAPALKSGYGWVVSSNVGILVRTRMRIEQGLVNPNKVGPVFLEALLEERGISKAAAARATAAIMIGTERGDLTAVSGLGQRARLLMCRSGQGAMHGSIQTLDDLAAFPMVGPRIAAAIENVLSFAEMDDPLPGAAGPVIRRALAHASIPVPPRSGLAVEGALLIVEAQVERGGVRIRRHAEVIFAGDASMQPWHVVRWETVPVKSD